MRRGGCVVSRGGRKVGKGREVDSYGNTISLRTQEARDKLRQMIENHVEAAICDAEKGGGDPADIPVKEAYLAYSKAQLERTIQEVLP
jgi:hypothetical protein